MALRSSAEVFADLVAAPAFKAGGTGDPRPAGSIPVHLRQHAAFGPDARGGAWSSPAWPARSPQGRDPARQPYLADTIHVAPGERSSVLIAADELGTWAWHCHILTHAERDTGMFGMVTTLIVQ